MPFPTSLPRMAPIPPFGRAHAQDRINDEDVRSLSPVSGAPKASGSGPNPPEPLWLLANLTFCAILCALLVLQGRRRWQLIASKQLLRVGFTMTGSRHECDDHG